MRRLLSIICIYLLLSSCTYPYHSWTREDTAREVAYAVVHVLDWGQTRTIAKNPDKFYELNPLLGRHPSVGKVNTYFALGLAGHVFLSSMLSKEYRKFFQYISFAIESFVVTRNYMIGINVSF